MNIHRTLRGVKNVIGGLLSGKDPLVAERAPEQWDAQFKQGKWDYLVSDIPPNTKRLVEMIEGTPLPRRVLDVGCGNGGLYFALKHKDVPVEYVGIDYSSEAILQAKAKFPDVTFFVGDATQQKHEWGQNFTIIIFNEVLYYIPALSTIDKYRTFLVPGGKTMISMYRSWRTILIALFLRSKKRAKMEYLPRTNRYPSFIIGTF